MKINLLNEQSGFTLVEMIFVVLLLSTLLTMVSLNFSGLQEQTTLEIVNVDLKVIRTAAKSYYLDRNAFPSSLNDLTGYLDELPEDKFLNGSGTKYRLSSTGSSCKVWSVGPDRNNDNGDSNKDVVLSFSP